MDEKEIDRRLKAVADVERLRDAQMAVHDNHRVDIIMLKFKEPEVEARCAAHIIENTDWPFMFTTFDNRNGLKNMSRIWNQLIAESTCDYVLIIDSDAFVPRLSPCWLTRMMTTLLDERADAIVPLVTRTSCIQQRSSTPRIPVFEQMREPFAAQCVLYPKQAFAKFGSFDEDFVLYGQDSEWSLRAMRAGARILLRNDVVVDHIGHYSIKKTAKSGEFDREIEGMYADVLISEKIDKTER